VERIPLLKLEFAPGGVRRCWPRHIYNGLVNPSFDVVGVGLNATDTLLVVPRFPAYAGKVPFEEEIVSPGGQVASAMAACARLGLRAKYIGAVGDDERGRIQMASLIEAGAPKGEMRILVRRYVEALMEQTEGRIPDVVMLGCTHYPLVADLFADALPHGLKILSQPDLVSRSLTAYLAHHPEIDAARAPATTQFLTTGDPQRTSILGSQFFGRPVSFEATAPTEADLPALVRI